MVGIFQHATFDMFDDTGGYDAMTPEGLINQQLKTAGSHCSLLSCSSISDCWDLAPWQSWRHGVFYKHQDNYIRLKSNYRLG
jgi:hypothetical protein